MTGRAAQETDAAPLAEAAARLGAFLAARWAASRTPGPAPRVAVLGAATVMTGEQADRRAADVHLSGATVLIGPFAAAADERTACGHCLAIRWQRLRTRTERDALETGGPLTAVGSWPHLTGYHLDAVWQLYRAVRNSRPPGPAPGTDPPSTRLARVVQLDLRTLRLRTVPLLADPRCPSCGTPEPADEPPPLTLRSRAKPGPKAYRLRAAADYPLPRAALANPVCGVLGAGTFLTITSPTTAPVSGSVFIRGYGGLLDVSWSGQATGFAASRSLAYLEGLERYAGTHHRRNRAPVVAAYREVADHALPPDACGMPPDTVYATDPVLRRFSPDRPIPWIWGHNLHTGRPVLVPRRLCFYSSPASDDTFVLSSSSGCATGSCLEEAALFGLLELIERDAFLLAWYGNTRLRRIDLDSCGPAVRDMVSRAELQGYRLLAFDNRIDLNVPVVTSVGVRRDGGPGILSFAAAAHVDPAQAVTGALAETLTYIPHLPDTVRSRRGALEAMADDYTLVQRLPDHSALFGLPRMAKHAASYMDEQAAVSLDETFADYTRPDTTDLRGDLDTLLGLLRDRGFEAVLVDQTTPEQEAAGLCSVCMIVPGLIPIDFGWSRQRAPYLPRMRTAARAAGLAPADLTDGDLRWVPHPFP